MAEKEIREFLEGREVFLQDFSVEVSKADPFVFEWHSHSRPGPSYHGHEHTDYLSDGDIAEVQTNQRYDYPCFDDADYKASVTGWTWLLLYHSRQYATDDQEYNHLRLIVSAQAIADQIVPVVGEVLDFGLQGAPETKTEDVSELVRASLSKKASFADLREAVS